MKRWERGQGLLLAIMCLGMIMAGVVLFGATKGRHLAQGVQKLDTGQAAYEALAAAGKRVQTIYANESGCDPETLDARLSRLDPLPVSASTLGTGLVTGSGTKSSYYVIAQPRATTQEQRENRCSGGTGCRQIAVQVENSYYIVTVGAVSSDPDTRTGDCARDASVRLSVAVNGNVFFQRFTLTNLCTLASCNCTTLACAAADAGFTSKSLTVSSGITTTACTGGNSNIPARRYGSLVSATNTLVTTNDLRWARTYLETGGGAVGDTNFIYSTTPVVPVTVGAVTVRNGACFPANSLDAGGAQQCLYSPCFPALDLNRDGNNNESDLAIMENYLRGYITSLPVNELD